MSLLGKAIVTVVTTCILLTACAAMLAFIANTSIEIPVGTHKLLIQSKTSLIHGRYVHIVFSRKWIGEIWRRNSFRTKLYKSELVLFVVVSFVLAFFGAIKTTMSVWIAQIVGFVKSFKKSEK